MKLRLAQLEHKNHGKKPEMMPKQCVFDSRNGLIIMEYYSQLPSHVFLFISVSWNSCPHYHLLVAYATPKTEAENPDFIRLLGQSLTKARNYSRGFGMLLACVGQQFNSEILARIITSWSLMRP